MEIQGQLSVFEKKATDVLRSRGFWNSIAAGLFYGAMLGVQEAGVAVNQDAVLGILGLFGINLAKYGVQDAFRAFRGQ